MNTLSCSQIIYQSSGSSYINIFAAPATCSLQFPLHFGLTINAKFALNPVCCIARGAGDKVMEFPLIFLHVPCRGIACGGKMGSLSPCSICPTRSPFQVCLPVTMLFIGYSWRARYGNSPWAGASESVSSLLYQEGKKFLCVSSFVLGLLGIRGAFKSHHPR